MPKLSERIHGIAVSLITNRVLEEWADEAEMLEVLLVECQYRLRPQYKRSPLILSIKSSSYFTQMKITESTLVDVEVNPHGYFKSGESFGVRIPRNGRLEIGYL